MTQVSRPIPGDPGASGDSAYLDKTLLHRPVELYFDESVAPRSLFLLWLRPALITGPVFLISGFLLIIVSIVDALAQLSATTQEQAGGGNANAGGGGGGGLAVLLLLIVILSFAAFWVILLASKLQEPISEWHVLLADRAPAAESVYNAIVGTSRDRSLPLYPYTRRLPTSFGPVSSRLVLVDGHYEAFITVFAYGTSLYLGWTMWRSRRGAHLLGRYIADMFRSMGGQLDPVAKMLRTEQARAMREAVHAVCREGLHVAVDQIQVPDNYAFPQGLPPIEGFAPSAPAPSPISAPIPAAPDAAGIQNSWAQPPTAQ